MAVALVVVAAAGAFAGWTVLMASFSSAGPAQQSVLVTIPAGASVARAARVLEEAGAVSSAERFRLAARLTGGDRPIQAGEYDIPARASIADILAKLQRGDVYLHRVTIPEGMASIQVFERLMAEPDLVGEIAMPAEGSVLPDTYSFTRGESRQAVLGRMQAAMTQALAAAWAARVPNLPLSTPEEAVILASIVEKETSKKQELTKVAGVYINRLRLGMKLQADPTVIYPVTLGKPLGRRIRRSELDAVNDYNTYTMVGLPKGPIANPSRRALEATLNPATTTALFFVADGTGGHVFADTYAEHNRNVIKWRQFRAEQGI
jgi:UPF0755 protein